MSENSVRGILHGVALSPFVRKVRCVLAMKGIDYQLVNVMPGAMDAGFREKSPLSKIPVWEEGDWTLPDSSAIVAYLERIAPQPALFPVDPKAYGEALFLEEYADTRLVESAAPIFFQRVVHEKVFKKASDEDIVRRQLDEVLPPVFDQIEAYFMPGLSFWEGAQGESSSIEDFVNVGTLALWSPLVNLLHADVEVDAVEWPRLARFLLEMNQASWLRDILEEERAALAAY
ncbi:MAG: glutathione S-transferase family protein [Myxococcota bacterium]